MANDNAILRKTIYPPRGLVLDKHKQPILTNTQTFDLMITPVQAKGMDTSFFAG